MTRWLVLLALFAAGMFATARAVDVLGPPHPVGFTCWQENGEPHCSAQAPSWMWTGEA